MTLTDTDRRRRIITNTVAQLVGRNGVALLRLVVAGLIVRSFGTATFAEYSLLFGILTLIEWLVDFGTSETFVRDIARDPGHQQARLRHLLASKAYTVPVAFAALAGGLWLMRYPAHVVTAGLVGGLSLVLFAGVLVYRVAFRARLAMERDAAAELVSVVAFIPMVIAVASSGGGLVALMASHVLSRVVYLGAASILGRHEFRPSISGVRRGDIHATLRASSVIGVIGLLAGFYELLDLLFLSKLAAISEVAHYSAAQRLIWPILMALTAIAGTLYPVAASYWPHAQAEFEQVCQRGIDTVVVLAGLAFSAMLAGPEFFLGLLGPQLVEAAPVLRLLALLCFVKAITSTVGPLLYIINAQTLALRFVITSVLVKSVVLVPLALAAGAVGVAAGALAIELLWAVTATVYLFQRFGGCRLQWVVAVKAAIAMTAAALIAVVLFPDGGLPAAIVAPLAYVPLTAASGAVRLHDVHVLLGRRVA